MDGRAIWLVLTRPQILDNGELGVATARDAARPVSDEDTTAAACSNEPEAVLASRSLASTSGVESVDGRGAVLVSPSDDPAAVASDTNAHGDDSQPDTLVANPASHVHPGCPDTPVVARLPVPRSHVVAGTAAPKVAVAARSAYSTGRAALSTAHAVPQALEVPPTSATARRYPPMRLPQHAPELIAALCLLSAAVPHGEPDPEPEVEEDIQAKFKSIKSTMNALFTGDAVPTKGHRSTSPGPPEEDDSRNVYEGAEREAELAALGKYKDLERDDGWWDDDAPVDPALLELLKPERRRHFF